MGDDLSKGWHSIKEALVDSLHVCWDDTTEGRAGDVGFRCIIPGILNT